MNKERREAIKAVCHASGELLRSEKAVRSIDIDTKTKQDALERPLNAFLEAMDTAQDLFDEEIELTK